MPGVDRCVHGCVDRRVSGSVRGGLGRRLGCGVGGRAARVAMLAGMTREELEAVGGGEESR
jgi:hypothetical protein